MCLHPNKLGPVNQSHFLCFRLRIGAQFAPSILGIPGSTTHNISAAIMGVGAARRFNAIKWTVVERMVWAWLLTIPVCAGLAYLLVRLLRLLS